MEIASVGDISIGRGADDISIERGVRRVRDIGIGAVTGDIGVGVEIRRFRAGVTLAWSGLMSL